MIPQVAVELVKHFEGLKLEPYRDAVGLPTIGYGHLLSRDRSVDLSSFPAITEAQAEELLQMDLQRMGKSVLRLVPVPLTDNQFGALISFTFNLGAGNLQISALRQKLLRQEYENAADEFPRWVYAGGKKLLGLVRRRDAERRVFLGY